VQRAVLVVTVACVPIGAIWLSSESIFLLCRLDPHLSALAGQYCVFVLPPGERCVGQERERERERDV